jgi:hypothetical protein
VSNPELLARLEKELRAILMPAPQAAAAEAAAAAAAGATESPSETGKVRGGRQTVAAKADAAAAAE